MRPSVRPPTLLLTLLLTGALPLAAGVVGMVGMVSVVSVVSTASAASFDCAKARTKLNRMICADAALSALDSQVGVAYGARIAGASVAHYAHLRERHTEWRRQRGLYERTIDTLKDDYQRHLAWLNHPLLAIEGRYEHDDDLSVQVETDIDAPARVSVQGHVKTAGLVRHTFAWTPSGANTSGNPVLTGNDAAEARPALTVTNGSAAFAPAFIGAPPMPVQDCLITLRFGRDELWLTTSGACGALFGGHYRRRVSAAAWGSQ